MRWPWQTKEDGLIAELDDAIEALERELPVQEVVRRELRDRIEEANRNES